ncbi:MAG: serine/threonine-protein kinase [Myxococcota bacterium]
MSTVVQDQGRRIAGKYELVEPVGEGGMASVWKGLTHGAAGFTRTVAIKRVLPSLSGDTKFAALFVEEARVVSDLQHPNIVQIHDFDQDELGSYFIVMEWVEGIDLARYVRSYNRVGDTTPWPYVAAVGIEVLRALTHAHERITAEGELAPVIHRDVTPSNILLGTNGIVKLADFGLARAMDRVSMTKPGTVKGKLAYMAPEVMHGQKASNRSDIYCLGICLFESLTGRRLFTGTSDLDLVMKVREGKIPDLGALRTDLPSSLVEIVNCALAKEPVDRFESAREMQRAIAAVLRTHPEPTDAEPLGRSVRLAIEQLPSSAMRPPDSP